MAVSSSVSAVQYQGNGSTSVAYPVPFLFFEASHLAVQVISAAGVVTKLELGSGFTATGAKIPGGGNVKTVAAWSASHTVTIQRAAPMTQPYVYTEGARLPMKTIERNFDWIVTLIQQVRDATRNVLKFPYLEASTSNMTLPSAGARKDSVIFFNKATGEMQTLSLLELAVKISTLLNGEGILAYRVIEIGNDYVVRQLDGNAFARVSATGPVVIYLPPTGDLAQSFSMEFSRVGAGSVTFEPQPGVTLDSSQGHRRIFNQFSSVALRVVGPNRYAIYGDLF